MNEIHHQMIHGLQLWMLLSVTAGLVGLYVRPGELARGFWLMMGLWGVVDGVIVWWSQTGEAPSLETLLFRLKVNLLLDLVYIAVGVLLAGRHAPVLRGFGWAVIIQGTFLLLFDLYFYRQCWE
jgi:hypothetical protein